jgi:protein SCO1/2
MGKRIATALILLAGTLVVLVLYLPGMRPQGTNPTQPAGTGSVSIGGAFTLQDPDGKTVTDADLKGRYSLIFFGFTHCPDICPLTLQTVTKALDEAGPAADHVQPVFITVDPERDTPDAMKAYAANFHPRLMALTGTPAQVQEASRAYKVFAAKTPLKDAEGKDTGDYGVTHTGFTYLMGPDGKYVAHFDKDASPADIAARLRQLPPA